MAIKDFNPEKCDAAYTMGIVDLLLECVELSHRSGNLFHIGTWNLEFSPCTCQIISIQGPVL